MMLAVTNPTVTVRRTIAASAEELFDAWLDPQSLAAWMRPGTIKRTSATVDAREGGAYEIVMQGDEAPIVHTGVYRLIDRPKRLVFTWKSPGTLQTDSLVTVDFRCVDRSTEVIVTHEQLPESALPSHTSGWTRALERLNEFLRRTSR